MESFNGKNGWGLYYLDEESGMAIELYFGSTRLCRISSSSSDIGFIVFI